jgi:uncharacterized protein
MDAPYRSHSSYLKDQFGGKVRRLALDAGFPCPHREGGRGPGGCLFCDARGSGTGAFDRGQSVVDQALEQIARLSRSGVTRYIAYFQAFTGTLAPLERLRALYREMARLEGVVSLVVSTRPDALPDRVLKLLASFAPGGAEETGLDVWVELGLQSSCDETLRRINRGHDAACFDDAVARAAAHGLKTTAHVILGLPGEGEKEILSTAVHVASLPVQGVKLHHLSVTSDSPLANAWRRGEIATLSLEEYIPLAIGFIRRQKRSTVVMRLCGSAPAERLLAPIWDGGSSGVAERIRKRMGEKGQRQGDL